jgi:6-pyruvoyltetrahydropterin/6-carboxytetrahydropterin synthase
VGWRIEVKGDDLRFAAAHMTVMGNEAEPLHGHNYRVTAILEGDLAQESWVLDFRELRRLMAEACHELDHRFILQRPSAALRAAKRGRQWEIRTGGRRYLLPDSDVVALPIDNCTAERLAEWLCGRLKERLLALKAKNLTAISVGVEESPGRTAWFGESLGGGRERRKA